MKKLLLIPVFALILAGCSNAIEKTAEIIERGYTGASDLEQSIIDKTTNLKNFDIIKN